MGKKQKNQEEIKIIVAEFSVSMHCNECERMVAKIISNLKGIEMFTTDMKNDKVLVKGKIDPQKILKKLRKKTGKKVEIIVKDKEIVSEEPKHGTNNFIIFNNSEEEKRLLDRSKDANSELCSEYYVTIFSDENSHACYIM